MTEEIIIDGVDVSECCFYNNGKCDNPNGMACNCINNAVCYFKELKCLEQENRELKAYKDVNEDFKKAWDELNEKYTEVLKLAKENADSNEYCLQELEQKNKELKDKITALEDKLQLRMASDKESDEFWDEIFSEKDYPFNKENAYKELKDYYFVLEQIPKIYMEITGGTLSKTTYFASSVIQAYNDALERYYDKIDDLEYNNNAYRSALEKIKEIIRADCKGCTAECDCDDDCTRYKIKNKINECLGG